MEGLTCLHKVPGSQPSDETDETHEVMTSVDGSGDQDADTAEVDSNKKTDESIAPPKTPAGGYLWRLSSGIVSTTTGAVTGAVGLGVGGVKWAAGKGYSAGSAVGSAVLGTTKTIASKVPTLKKKDKKE